MNNTNQFDKEYKDWIIELKSKIRSVQLKAVSMVNVLLIEFYWDLGHMIVEKQKQTQWGDKMISQLSKDLHVLSFPI